MLSGLSVLITGGTGSFGKKFVELVLKQYPDIGRLVVYSRDELKQYEMALVFPPTEYPQLRFFIGDVRDKERLGRAMEGVDVVVHAAALKQISACEYNPFEAIKTNVIGAQNVIENAIDLNISKVVALSTDKAAAPINLYGATKLCSDKLFVTANNFKGNRRIKFSVVRYGNVMGSRGSVIPLYMERRSSGVLPVTDENMTRFNITLTEGVDFVLFALKNMWGGEVFVPKIPSYRITDVAEAVGPECRRDLIGIRAGEKIHEDMITETDAVGTLEFEDHFVILPSEKLWDVDDYARAFEGKPCRPGFSYSSDSNEQWLSVSELRSLINEHVDPAFEADTIHTNKRRFTVVHPTTQSESP